MANFCENCGSPLRAGAKFCTECGFRLPEDGSGNQTDLIADSAAEPAPPEQPAANEVRRAVPAHRAQKQKQSVCQPEKAGSRQEPVQRVPEQKSASGPKKSKGSTGLAVFLSLLMAVEAAVAGFKYPGWFKKKEINTGNNAESNPTENTSTENNSTAYHLDQETAELLQPIFDYAGITAADYEEYMNDPIEVTADNSPGNPAFIELSFSEDEYAAAKTLTAEVSPENPTADFSEFGIHADLKSWNLEHETDTLIVKQMSTKTDASTGATCYTYDYSLASGQSKFLTNVDITVPIEGDPDNLANIVTIDPDTGKWTEVYYSVSEDGRSCTFSLDHFTLITKMSLEDGEKAIANFTYTDGKSIFCQLSREGAAKYEETSHYLYNVGILNIPNFEKYLEHDTVSAANVLEDFIKKNNNGEGGDIPAEAGMAQSVSWFGDKVDDAAFSETLRGLSKKALYSEKASGTPGSILTLIGIMIMGLRIVNQYTRGVDGKDIILSNKWGILGTVATITGLFLTGGNAAVVLAFVGCLIYLLSKYEQANETKPFTKPRTIEESAYQYYLTEYGKQDKRYVPVQVSGDLSRKAYAKMLGNTEAVEAAASIASQADGTEKTWTRLLKDVFEKYQKEPAVLGGVIELSYDLYVSRYWELEHSAEAKEACWKGGLERILKDGNDYYYNSTDYSSDYFQPVTSDPKKDAEKLGITLSEFRRRSDIQYATSGLYGKNADAITAEWKSVAKYQYTPDSAEIQKYKEKARSDAFSLTMPILYTIYTDHYKQAVVDVRKKIYHEILPWLNTRLTFYWHDPAVKSGKMSTDSLYYQFFYKSDTDRLTFAFDCDTNETLFLPGNKDSMTFEMFLYPNKSNNVLLETTIYNYMMWKGPKDVMVFKTKAGKSDPDLVMAKVDFTGIELKADPNSCKNGNSYINIDPVHRNIKDIKVPIVPGGYSASDLSRFFGTWESPPGDRQYRVTIWEKNWDNGESSAKLSIDYKTKSDKDFTSGTPHDLREKTYGWVYILKGNTLLLSEYYGSGKDPGFRLNDKNWEYRFTLKGQKLIMEEWHYVSEDLGDTEKEIRSYELSRVKEKSAQ